MTATATQRSVVIEKVLPHPPEKVWRALTQGALIEAWLLKNDFQPVVGHRFTFRSIPMPQWNGIIDGEVMAVEPHKRLSYTWESMGLKTVVTFTLTPQDGGTLLRLEQSGFASDKDQNYMGATYGWKKFLGGLETVLQGMAA